MATPFVHTHVSHVSRTGRRRSRSLTMHSSKGDDNPGQSSQRKQFLAQLQNERQKQRNKSDGHHKERLEDQDEPQQDEDNHYQPVVTRVPGTQSTHPTNRHTLSKTAMPASMKKQMSLTGHQAPVTEYDENDQPVVTRKGRAMTMTAMNKYPSSMEPTSGILQRDVTSISSATIHSEEDDRHPGNQSQAESKMALSRKISTKTTKSSNITGMTTDKISNLDSFLTFNGSNLHLIPTSSNPFLSSSTNIMSKSEIFDEDTKRHGKINISGPEKRNYTDYDRKLAARSSASCMAATIAIIIGIIGFAFGLTSLVLVLFLRSTVASQLGTNSTTSGSSSSGVDLWTTEWTNVCSSHTTLDDPTRNVNAVGYGLGCDNTAPFINRTTRVWIRFVGTGGTTLPLTTPGMNLCGSEGTGWYDGIMPSAGQIINGTACFTWYTGVCRYSQSVRVANCGSFYIYLLPPAPACMMRYCTI